MKTIFALNNMFVLRFAILFRTRSQYPFTYFITLSFAYTGKLSAIFIYGISVFFSNTSDIEYALSLSTYTICVLYKTLKADTYFSM